MTNEELRRLAEDATPGDWPIGIPVTVHEYVSRWIGIPHSQGAYHVELRDNDAAYIAAANPATVLALLNRLAEAEAIVAQVRGGVSPRARLCAAMGQWLDNQQHWTDLPDDHPVLESRATDGSDFVITAGMIREANR